MTPFFLPVAARRAALFCALSAFWAAPVGLTPSALAVELPDAPTATASVDTPAVWRGDAAAIGVASQTGRFATDPEGGRSSGRTLVGGRTRFGLRLDTGERLGSVTLLGEVAGEAGSGTWRGTPSQEGIRLPGSQRGGMQGAAAWAGARWGKLADVRGGLMASHWGLGLLANDGNPSQIRDQWFTVPHIGDRVWRAALTLSPFADGSSALRGLYVSFAMDKVHHDDILVAGDTANQLIGAVRYFVAKDQWLGFYYAGRKQEAPSGRNLDVHAFDLAADLRKDLGWAEGRLQAEGVLITGTTTLAPTPDFPVHDVLQGALLVRASAEKKASWKAELDLGWFSGDASLDDKVVGNFKADPNLQMGILLYPRVLAWQSGRAHIGASDPDLLGYPPEDLDRIATTGSITSSTAIFPKFGVEVCPGFAVYGGALVALATSPMPDPKSSRVSGGGEPRNYLGNKPDGMLLGTELDLGLRIKARLPGIPASVQLGAEGAVLLPGGVLAGMDDPVFGGRLSLAWLPDSN